MIFPTDLQQKVIKTAYKLGHLGITKTKQAIITTYRFPNMNAMIHQMIAHCIDWQVTTKDHRKLRRRLPTIVLQNKFARTMVHHSSLRSFQTSPKKKDQSHPWRHPRANGQAKRFIQTLKKTAQTAHLQRRTGFERNKAIYDMLVVYRDAQHPADGVTPYRGMFNKPIWRKLEHTITRLKKKTSNGEWWKRGTCCTKTRWSVVA